MTISKRAKLIAERVEAGRVYSLEDAFTLLKELSTHTTFQERIDVAIRLGVDVRKSDQMVRGAFVLPHGMGKTVKVGVFAVGDAAKAALEAGADRVGSDDFVDEIKKGMLDYAVMIATPDMMPVVGKLGPILGRKGLMPNPKLGTVTKDVAKAVSQAKTGQIRYRTEKASLVHASLGNETFSVAHLGENLKAFVTELKRVKPKTAKGVYLRKVVVSSTMGPGLDVDLACFS